MCLKTSTIILETGEEVPEDLKCYKDNFYTVVGTEVRNGCNFFFLAEKSCGNVAYMQRNFTSLDEVLETISISELIEEKVLILS